MPSPSDSAVRPRPRDGTDRTLVWTLALACFFGLLSWVGWIVRVVLPVLAGQLEGFDFKSYLIAARRALESPLLLYASVKGGYIYPPPAILLFMPWTPLSYRAAYAMWATLSLLAWVGCWWVAVRMYELEFERSLTSRARVGLLALALAGAPVTATLKIGQLNLIVAFVALSALYLLRRKRPLAAGLLVSLGFWLKLYPAILFGLGAAQRRLPRFGAGLASGLILVPLAALPLVPASLYESYFLDVLPRVGQLTNLSGTNQSVIGMIEQLDHPVMELGRYSYAPAGLLSRALAATLAAVVILAFYREASRPGPDRTVGAGLALLAATPLLSPLGWEHTYVFMLPLSWWLLAATAGEAAWLHWLAAAIAVTTCVPKAPDSWILTTADAPWAPLWRVFYWRYALADFTALALAYVLLRRRGRFPKPPFGDR